MIRMDEFTLAYFEAALWSSTDDDGEPLDANYGIEDFAPETSEKMIADCADFQERFDPLIESGGGDWGRAGRDFWLTRNGHGAGFWDGDWPEPQATELTNAAHEYGEFYLYIGDDGLIYGPPPGAYGVRAPRRYQKPPRHPPRHHVTPPEATVDASHHVADFNTLEDLIEHAQQQLGATHVTVELVRGTGRAGPGTKIYFPRGGQYPYEEARVWREGRYWHAEGPGARAGIRQLPTNAMTIERYLTRGGRRRQAAETPSESTGYTTKPREGDYTTDDVFLDGHWIGEIKGPFRRAGRRTDVYQWYLRSVSAEEMPPFGMRGGSGESRTRESALNALIRADKARLERYHEHQSPNEQERHSWRPSKAQAQEVREAAERRRRTTR